MKKISITKKESRQNLISSLLLTVIFGLMAYMMHSTALRIAFMIPGIIFAVYFLVWSGIVLYHMIGHIPYSEPEEPVTEEKEEKSEEEAPKPERKYRTYSPLKDILDDEGEDPDPEEDENEELKDSDNAGNTPEDEGQEE